MKFIYVLEDDERSQKDLFETIRQIDPQLNIRYFPTLELFHKFLSAVMTDGALALASHGLKIAEDTSEDVPVTPDHELRLIIAKYEMFGKKNMNLIKRAHEFLQRKKVSTEDGSLILTAFDSPDFDIALAEERIINNVIFKPFDKLILKQHIEYALTGHHPVKSDTVATIQLKSTLEMLKEVTMHSLSEVGFTTINNHEIKIGAFTKYYSDVFKTDDKRSVYAYCSSCTKHGEDEYICQFLFFGVDNKQISQIRRMVLQNKSHKTEDVKHLSLAPHLKILILDEDVAMSLEVRNFLLEKMSSVEIFVYNHYAQFLSDLADKDTANRQELPHEFDIVIGNHDVFYSEKEKRWEQIINYLKDRKKKHSIVNDNFPVLYLISKHKILPDEVRSFSLWAKELFFAPLDKGYLLKRLLSADDRFSNKENTHIASLEEPFQMKVANPVEITEISEAGLILKYHRAMSVGAFREFILWRPQELELPEIIGTVNFTEKDKSGGDYYLNHFVFFGMKDYYLKHIRLWLRDAHIKSKEKE